MSKKNEPKWPSVAEVVEALSRIRERELDEGTPKDWSVAVVLGFRPSDGFMRVWSGQQARVPQKGETWDWRGYHGASMLPLGRSPGLRAVAVDLLQELKRNSWPRLRFGKASTNYPGSRPKWMGGPVSGG